MNYGDAISGRRRGGRSTTVTSAAMVFALAFLLASWAATPEARSEAGVPTAQPAVTADDPGARATAERRRRGRPIYWGAWIGDQLTGEPPPWDMGAVHRFERIAGKRLSLIEFAAPFAECYSSNCNFYDFPATEMQRVRRHGAIPFFSWSSQSIPGKVREPAFQLSDVIRGRFDRYIRGWARAAKRWGHPFFLRFNWEMNGNWFPWGVGVNGNRRPQFVRAWRHVHRIFSRVGARNATWVWCPFVDPEGRDNLRAFYPGGRFVDWTCIDGYNWGRGNPALSRPWRSFGELFRSSYRRIVRRIARRKPMIIGEVASSDYGGSKAAWIRNMLAKVPRRYPKIRGLIWFNADDRGANWQIESSRSSRRAFRRGISRGVYRANRFGRIHRNPIRPARGRR